MGGVCFFFFSGQSDWSVQVRRDQIVPEKQWTHFLVHVLSVLARLGSVLPVQPIQEVDVTQYLVLKRSVFKNNLPDVTDKLVHEHDLYD